MTQRRRPSSVTLTSPPPSIWIPATSTSLASTSSSRTNLPTGAIWRSYRSRSETDPLLLTELGLDSGEGEDRQADSLDWQVRGTMELGLAGTCIFSWTDDWWVGDTGSKAGISA